jgi:hypothetical protein
MVDAPHTQKWGDLSKYAFTELAEWKVQLKKEAKQGGH